MRWVARRGWSIGVGLQWLALICLVLVIAACGQADDLSSPTATSTATKVTSVSTPVATATPERKPSVPTQTRVATPQLSPTNRVPTTATASDEAHVETVNTPTLRPPGGSPEPQTNIVGTSAVSTPVPPTSTPIPPTVTATAIPSTPIPTVALPAPTPTATIALPTPTPELCPGAIPWYEAINNVGSAVTVIGPVVGAVYASDSAGAPTFLNIGANYPDASRFTALIWVEYRANFPAPPEDMYAGATVCVAGVIDVYDGVAEILVTGPDQISIP